MQNDNVVEIKMTNSNSISTKLILLVPTVYIKFIKIYVLFVP